MLVKNPKKQSVIYPLFMPGQTCGDIVQSHISLHATNLIDSLLGIFTSIKNLYFVFISRTHLGAYLCQFTQIMILGCHGRSIILPLLAMQSLPPLSVFPAYTKQQHKCCFQFLLAHVLSCLLHKNTVLQSTTTVPIPPNWTNVSMDI